MNYYVYNTDRTGFIGVKSDYPKQLSYADAKDIPLANAVLLDGQLFDNREIDYWKLLKTKELVNFLQSADNAGFVTSLGIKSDCSELSINKLNLGLSNYNLIETKDSDKVGFCDYDNSLHSITFADYKIICKEVGADFSNRYSKKWTVRKAINKAKTIEELKAIII